MTVTKAFVGTLLFLLVAGLCYGDRRDKDRQIAKLQRENATLTQRAEGWKAVALEFEKLNRQCLQITFGGTR